MAVTRLIIYPLTLLNLCAAGPGIPCYRRGQELALGGSTAGPFGAILWPAPSTQSKQELCQPWPGLGCRVPRAPSKAGLGLLTQTPKRKHRSSESTAHATHRGKSGKGVKPRVVRRWGTVVTAREREEEVEVVSLKVGSGERFLQEAQMVAHLLEHLPVCKGWQNRVKHPTLASSPWQALQQK